MGTETLFVFLFYNFNGCIWRYSPRNGDGNFPFYILNGSHQLFGDIVPGMGTETNGMLHKGIDKLFGDIVSGMGTETIVICCGR